MKISSGEWSTTCRRMSWLGYESGSMEGYCAWGKMRLWFEWPWWNVTYSGLLSLTIQIPYDSGLTPIHTMAQNSSPSGDRTNAASPSMSSKYNPLNSVNKGPRFIFKNTVLNWEILYSNWDFFLNDVGIIYPSELSLFIIYMNYTNQ